MWYCAPDKMLSREGTLMPDDTVLTEISWDGQFLPSLGTLQFLQRQIEDYWQTVTVKLEARQSGVMFVIDDDGVKRTISAYDIAMAYLAPKSGDRVEALVRFVRSRPSDKP